MPGHRTAWTSDAVAAKAARHRLAQRHGRLGAALLRPGWQPLASGGRAAAPDPDTASEMRGERDGEAGHLLAARTSPARQRATARNGHPTPCAPDPPPGSPQGRAARHLLGRQVKVGVSCRLSWGLCGSVA